jgi:hypothetical protein
VWPESAFNVLIDLFECVVGLKMNTKKMQVMTCVNGKIRESMSKEVYHNSRLGPTLSTNWKGLQVDCNICGETLQASSLQSHLEMQHNIYPLFLFFLNWELTVEIPTTFCAHIHTATSEYDCPVPGCVGTANTGFNLRHHFVMHHPTHLVVIPMEGLLPLP